MLPMRAGEQRTTVLERRSKESPAGLAVTLESSNSGSVTVRYEIDGTPVAFRLDLRAIPQHFGGVRRLIECPLRAPNGEPCDRAARVLYLPPGAKFFGCRRCHR